MRMRGHPKELQWRPLIIHALLLRMDPSTGRMLARDLSEDHKPDGPRERARIEGGGGRVHPSLVPGRGFAGPARVWDPSQRFGLATSRSMGDNVYAGPNRSGVSCSACT